MLVTETTVEGADVVDALPSPAAPVRPAHGPGLGEPGPAAVQVAERDLRACGEGQAVAPQRDLTAAARHLGSIDEERQRGRDVTSEAGRVAAFLSA